MAVVLFVETLNADKSLGYTKNEMMLLENANKITYFLAENFGNTLGLMVSPSIVLTYALWWGSKWLVDN